MNDVMTASQKMDALEDKLMDDLQDAITVRSRLFLLAEADFAMPNGVKLQKEHPGAKMLMSDDPRLPKMPDKPTLIDFFKLRFAPPMHLLQSARHAKIAGMPEKIVLACLLHDIAVLGFIRSDHGYWGAQMVEPYVDEEVTWAIRAHQALRFYPDEEAGYAYPDNYKAYFGEGYQPPQYIEDEYKRARAHKWYGTARMICVHDLYSFDPDVHVELEEFTDIIGRNFRQPEEGLGFDNSPSAHMWRTLRQPTKYL
jgi:hypothetical protein